jgi:DNA polymerase III subunit delta'
MKNLKENIEVLPPKNQIHLYGYQSYFNNFLKLIDKEKLPNSILFTGPKGLGKATFAYHLINYILSKNENYSYKIDDLSINSQNSSYKLLCNNTHPNFYLVDCNKTDNEIKVDQIRNLVKFINKSTYTKDLKVILIDKVENLNLNASNSLLKALEETSSRTFFFLVHNNSFKISETIKSRCNEFKIFLSIKEKEKVFNNLCLQYNIPQEFSVISKNLFFDTPGNIINAFSNFGISFLDIEQNTLKFIHDVIDKYVKKKDSQILFLLSVSIVKFYYNLYIKNINNLNIYSFNLSKILKQIDNIKKFNIDEKAIFLSIKDTLLYDGK